MCGIVGVTNANGFLDSLKREKFFQEALYVDQLRGFHSTGMYLVRQNGEIDWAKRSMCAHDFLDLKTVTNLINKAGGSVFTIGHNRHATMGALNNSNAHPFDFNKLIGVHNGTLRGAWRKAINPNGKFDVDSEALYASIEDIGLQETVNEVEGAMALAWYDKDEEVLNLYRNPERPLAYGIVKGGKSVVLASEGAMVWWLAHRNGIEIERMVHIQDNELHSFNIKTPCKAEIKKVAPVVKKIISLPMGRGGRKKQDQIETAALDSIKLKKEDRIEVSLYDFKQYAPKNPYGYALGVMMDEPFQSVVCSGLSKKEWDEIEENGGYYTGKIIGISEDEKHCDQDFFAVVVSATSLSPIESVDAKPDNKQMVKGPGGKEITVKEFKKATKGGCANCTCNIDVKDADNIGWLNNSIEYPLCKDCKEVVNLQ